MLWRSSKEACGDQDEVDARKYQKMFWTMALTHNQASWYVVSPLMGFSFFRLVPSWQFGGDTEWTYVLICVTILSWTGALYPLYKLDCCLKPKTDAKGYKLMDVENQRPVASSLKTEV